MSLDVHPLMNWFPPCCIFTNTNIKTVHGAIITNAGLNKTALSKVAGMAHDGFARAIRPVHTMFDGDTVYAMSSGSVPSDINTVGVLTAEVMAQAIARAARPEGPSYGIRKADAEVK